MLEVMFDRSAANARKGPDLTRDARGPARPDLPILAIGGKMTSSPARISASRLTTRRLSLSGRHGNRSQFAGYSSLETVNMDTIKPLFTATATATGGRNG